MCVPFITRKPCEAEYLVWLQNNFSSVLFNPCYIPCILTFVPRPIQSKSCDVHLSFLLSSSLKSLPGALEIAAWSAGRSSQQQTRQQFLGHQVDFLGHRLDFSGHQIDFSGHNLAGFHGLRWPLFYTLHLLGPACTSNCKTLLNLQ